MISIGLVKRIEMSSDKDNLVNTVTDIVEEVTDEKTTKQSKIAQVAKEVVEFFIHCFKCKNAKGTPVLVHRDSLKGERPIRKTGPKAGEECNSFQISGTCAGCGKTVRGFVTAAKAKELGFEVTPPPKKVLVKKRKASDADVDVPDEKKAKVTVSSDASGPVEVKESKE